MFVSDGVTMVTLWRVADPVSAAPFDRRANVGLHHLALAVPDPKALAMIYDRIRRHPGVTIEFAPQPMGEAFPVDHFICTMPGGVRLEFATTIGQRSPAACSKMRDDPTSTGHSIWHAGEKANAGHGWRGRAHGGDRS